MMRNILYRVTIAAGLTLLPATALAQSGGAQLQGFGGMTMRGVNPASTLGGNIAVPVGGNIQILAEGGRMSDVMSGPLATLIDFSPVDVRVSAYYGEAGLRVLGSSSRAIRPYAEATAGFARLRTNVAGIGARTDAIVNLALGFVDSTQPIFGTGAGVMIQGGPLLVDLGYRYHRLGAGTSVQSALMGGNLNVHEVRVGVGVRF